MILHKKDDNTLVKVLDFQEVISPAHQQVKVRVQNGEEEQEPESVSKQDLIFPSGESLPKCWVDANYRMQWTVNSGYHPLLYPLSP